MKVLGISSDLLRNKIGPPSRHEDTEVSAPDCRKRGETRKCWESIRLVEIFLFYFSGNVHATEWYRSSTSLGKKSTSFAGKPTAFIKVKWGQLSPKGKFVFVSTHLAARYRCKEWAPPKCKNRHEISVAKADCHRSLFLFFYHLTMHNAIVSDVSLRNKWLRFQGTLAEVPMRGV